MSLEVIHCPYCNAALSPAELDLEQARIPCPRCGDSFPNKWTANQAAPNPSGAELSQPLQQDPPSSMSNARIARNILVLMGLVAGISIFFALITLRLRRLMDAEVRPEPPAYLEYAAFAATVVFFLAMVCSFVIWRTLRQRRVNHRESLKPDVVERASLIAGVLQMLAVAGLASALFAARFERQIQPIDSGPLATVGYLPPECSLVAGWNLAEMRKQPEGLRFLQETRDSKMDFGLAQVERWTGLKAKDIEMIVVGVHSGEMLPRLTVVVRTQQPYRLKTVFEVHKPAKPSRFRDSYVWQLPLSPMGKVLLWCRNNRTLLLDIHLAHAGLSDLKALPKKPHKGIVAFPKSVQNGLQELSELNGKVLWVSGDFESFSKIRKRLDFFGVRNKNSPGALKLIEAFHCAVILQEQVVLDLAIKAVDQKSAAEAEREMSKVLTELKKKMKSRSPLAVKLMGPNSKNYPSENKSKVFLRMSANIEDVALVFTALRKLLPVK